MGNDLISKEDIAREFEFAEKYVIVDDSRFDVNEIKKRIMRIPTVDAVEVVRCKDCKRRYDSKLGYVVCVWFNKTVRADGYCSYGCKMDAEARDVD